jgi:hypothetical protein
VEKHSRSKHLKGVFGPWWAVVSALWASISAADTLVGKYGSASTQAAWNMYWKVPKWGWEVWAIGALLITCAFLFEFSFRLHKNYETLACKAIADLQQKVEVLTWPPERPQIAFHGWGQIPPQFAPGGAKDTSSYIFQHGFYLENDGGAALEVTVEGFKFGLFDARSETISRIEGKNKGFAKIWLGGAVQINPLVKWNLDTALLKTWGAMVDQKELTLRDPLLLPISVIYRDYNNLWYRSKCELRFICRYGGTGCSITFGPPIQERLPRPQVRQ